MNFENCIKFATENPTAHIATVKKDQPRLRAIGLWFADSTGFYFQTSTFKHVVRQLKENPKIALGFISSDSLTQLIVNGEAEVLDDLDLKNRLMNERPYLEDPTFGGLSVNNPALIIFRVAKGEAYFWSMETNLEPKQIIKFG